MLKSILIFIIKIIIFYLKFTLFLLLFIILLAKYESNEIFNARIFGQRTRFTNYSIRPMGISTQESPSIGTILYVGYWNLVFNMTFWRVEKINDSWFNIQNKLYILKKGIEMYKNINKYSIIIALDILKIKKNNAPDDIQYILISKFFWWGDSRILVRIGHKWHAGAI